MRKAFTLIELLVVIAIIAILAAILFPVFAQAKASAKNTADLSNMKQLMTCTLIYGVDYDDMWVPVGASDRWQAPLWNKTPVTHPDGPAPGVPWMGWGLRIQPYMKNREILRSPMLARTGAYSGTCASSAGMELTNTYSMNWMLGRDASYGFDLSGNVTDPGGYGSSPSGTVMNTPVSQTAINTPANTIAYLLSNSLPPYGRTWGCIYTTVESSDFINKIRFRAIHRNGGNLAFADGHAKFYAAKEADAAGNASGTGPSHTIYHWRSRQMWMQPTMPDDTMGYNNSPAGFGG